MNRGGKSLKIFIIAGELSGDRLGADLISGLHDQYSGKIALKGIGGPMMSEAGLKSIFDMSDLSIMGLVEIIPKIPMLLSRIKKTVDRILDFQPDILITIDSPDFCARVTKKVKEHMPNLKVVHYVAPSVWAWRPERAEKMASHVDHVLALLPFEPPLMEAAGMSCDFVGHPVIHEPQPSKAEIAQFAKDLGLNRNAPIITLLPGSRKSEINRMMPVFQEVCEDILKADATAQFILPTARNVEELVKEKLLGWETQPRILPSLGQNSAFVEAQKRLSYAISDAALATSGTVALELAAQSCPMVVAYQANWATTRMVKKLAQIDTANLVNILTESRIIPEFLFENCKSGAISPALIALLQDKVAISAQKDALSASMAALGKGKPNMRQAAAKSVLNFLE